MSLLKQHMLSKHENKIDLKIKIVETEKKFVEKLIFWKLHN